MHTCTPKAIALFSAGLATVVGPASAAEILEHMFANNITGSLAAAVESCIGPALPKFEVAGSGLAWVRLYLPGQGTLRYSSGTEVDVSYIGDHREGRQVKTTCGRCHVDYEPGRNPRLPWAIVVRGEPATRVVSLEAAAVWLRENVNRTLSGFAESGDTTTTGDNHGT